jgi:hypothetical protein
MSCGIVRDGRIRNVVRRGGIAIVASKEVIEPWRDRKVQLCVELSDS